MTTELAPKTITLPLDAPCFWESSHDEYHGRDDLIGNSAKEFFAESPRLYGEVYVNHTRLKREPTKDLRIGIYSHVGLWEPMAWPDYQTFPETTLAGEPWNLRTKAHKLERDQFYAAAAAKGVVLIDPEEKATAELCVRGVLENPRARALVEADGPCERGVLWPDADTGLPLKCRPDKLILSQGLVLDLKTTDCVDPESFAKTAARCGYHRTAAWYLDGLHEVTGEELQYLFVVVSKISGECALIDLEQEAIDLGYRQNQRWKARMAKCYEAGEWVADYEKRITTVNLPRYEYQSENYEVD